MIYHRKLMKDTFRAGQNGWQCVEGIFRCFTIENGFILIKISLKLVTDGSINNANVSFDDSLAPKRRQAIIWSKLWSFLTNHICVAPPDCVDKLYLSFLNGNKVVVEKVANVAFISNGTYMHSLFVVVVVSTKKTYLHFRRTMFIQA